ncbi:hypothetical protein G6F65_020402 [Rhizopus arrhizus]|nr:hypothetical protein G6F65_020402 [Rhizopus arrhizus]
MAAAFDDAAVGQHDDLVRVRHGGQAVGDDQRAAALADFPQVRLDFAFGVGVQRAGGLVEQEDGRVLQDRARNGHALLFPARQLQAPFAHHGLVAVGHGHDQVMDVRQPCGSLDVGVGGAGPAVADVVVDGVVEQHRVLRHHADRRPQAGLGDIAHVLAVDDDRAAIGVVEAE